MSNSNYNFTARLAGLNNINADSIDTSNLIAEIMNIGTLSASDITTNTLTANSNFGIPLLTRAGHLDLIFVGGIYNHCPHFGVDTGGGYGEITMTGQFDIQLQSTVGKIILFSKVNQSTGVGNVCVMEMVVWRQHRQDKIIHQ